MNHELPQGWQETTLGEVVAYASTNKVEPGDIRDNTWVLELEDIEKSSSRLLDKVRFSDRKSKSTKNLFKKGDVLYGKLRPYLDKVIIANEDGVCTTEIIPLQPSEFLDNRFLFYNLKRREFLDYVADASHGVNMPRLGTKQGKEAPFVLAPLSEQIRIADKLDRILARVNAAQARLDKIPTLIKRFRQSVLAAATSGELTQEWRGSSGIGRNQSPITIGQETSTSPEGWEWKRLQDIAELESGHTPRKSEPEYWEGGDVLWISLQDIRSAHGKVIYDTKFKPTQKGIDNSSARMLPVGTVCFSRDISVGFTTIMGERMATTQHFANWICGGEISNFYLMYSLMSAQQYLTLSGKGSTVKTIYMPALKEFYVLCPPMEEQHEIVRRVESLFALADSVEKQYQDAKARTDRLTQAILAKAFRGELVPQNPDDEPAEVLLKRIRQQRAEQAAVSNKRNTKTNAAPKKSSDKSKRLHSKDNKVKPAITSGDDLLNLLTELGGEADASALWKKSGLSIDNFYALLKSNDKIEDHNPSSDPAQRKLRVTQ